MATLWHHQALIYRRIPSSRMRRLFYADFSDIADTLQMTARQLTLTIRRFSGVSSSY